MGNLIKIPVVSAYYVIYVMFERWMCWEMVVAWSIAVILGIQLVNRGREIGKRWYISVISLAAVLYVGILFWVFQCGGLVVGVHETILRVVYFLCSANK